MEGKEIGQPKKTGKVEGELREMYIISVDKLWPAGSKPEVEVP